MHRNILSRNSIECMKVVVPQRHSASTQEFASKQNVSGIGFFDTLKSRRHLPPCRVVYGVWVFAGVWKLFASKLFEFAGIAKPIVPQHISRPLTVDQVSCMAVEMPCVATLFATVG